VDLPQGMPAFRDKPAAAFRLDAQCSAGDVVT